MGRWHRGQSGNPRGRPPAGESFADALRSRLTTETMAEIADKVIALALGGNLPAISFIADRLDGKPRQALEHSAGEDKPLLVIGERCSRAHVDDM
jgi:Family of unknown function (DUF5681)